MPTLAAVETALPATADAEPSLLETVRGLPEEGQRAVLSYALFLRHQEEERQKMEAYHDAEWERLLNDPVKVANFTKWADEVFATQKPEPFDFSKL